MENANVIVTDKEVIDEAAAIQALKDYLLRTGKSQAAVAKELGVSDGLVSSFLKGIYKTPHTLIPKVEQLLRMTEKKLAAPTEPPFKMTSVSQQVTNIITYCHLRPKSCDTRYGTRIN